MNPIEKFLLFLDGEIAKAKTLTDLTQYMVFAYCKEQLLRELEGTAMVDVNIGEKTYCAIDGHVAETIFKCQKEDGSCPGLGSPDCPAYIVKEES